MLTKVYIMLLTSGSIFTQGHQALCIPVWVTYLMLASPGDETGDVSLAKMAPVQQRTIIQRRGSHGSLAARKPMGLVHQ